MIPILALENPISFINKIKYELSKVNKEKITLNDTNGKKNLEQFLLKKSSSEILYFNFLWNKDLLN